MQSKHFRQTKYHQKLCNTRRQSIGAFRGFSILIVCCLFSSLIFCQEDLVDSTGNSTEPEHNYVRYNGLKYSCPPAVVIDSFVRVRRVNLGTTNSGYRLVHSLMLNLLKGLMDRQAASKGVEDAIMSTTADSSNYPLCRKLYLLGLLRSEAASSLEVRNAVAKIPELFGDLDKGVMTSASLKALNVPVTSRISELTNAITLYEWLSCSMEADYKTIIVNIPSANLMLFERGSVAFKSKVIVGKPTTPTQTITANLSEIVMYPYWMVPNSIATKELLPKIKKNIRFLEEGGYQVLNTQGKITDPDSIDWNALSRSYFPYLLRQSTGCDNSLGIIKLNFYNPFSAYLHDTPEKALFSRQKRFYSHGCIRVEKALELGKIILGDNRIAIDSFDNKPFRVNQKPTVIPVREKANIFVIYSTVWMDMEGIPKFYSNIYRL